MGKYDDIINTVWPQATGRPRMDMESRAKIFLPFSALKSFGEAIDEKNKDIDNLSSDYNNKDGENYYE